jgi:hypothetical protein
MVDRFFRYIWFFFDDLSNNLKIVFKKCVAFCVPMVTSKSYNLGQFQRMIRSLYVMSSQTSNMDEWTTTQIKSQNHYL